MPLFHTLIRSLDESELQRYAGLREEGAIPREYLERVKKVARLVIDPKGIYEEYSYDSETGTVYCENPVVLEALAIRKHLEGAEKVVLLAVTVGEAIEEQSSSYFKENEYTLGVLLDAAATTAVEQVANELQKLIEEKARKRGYYPTWRFSPGYGNWPVEAQRDIESMIDLSQIGLSVTETCMLFPRKSVTAIMGLKRECREGDLSIRQELRGCSSCNQRDCASRKK